MVSVGFKSQLVFYSAVEEVDYKFKNGKERKQKQKFGGPMTQERYVEEILKSIVRRRQRYCQRNGMEFIFQEDNDSAHGTRSEENICKHYKCLINLDYIDDWPPKSPDLNPIEMVWRIVKSRVKLHHSMSETQLREAIQKEWDAIKQEEIDDIILGGNRVWHNEKKVKQCGMPARIAQCIERKGLSTEF